MGYVSLESQGKESTLDVTGIWKPLWILEQEKTQIVPSQARPRTDSPRSEWAGSKSGGLIILI